MNTKIKIKTGSHIFDIRENMKKVMPLKNNTIVARQIFHWCQACHFWRIGAIHEIYFQKQCLLIYIWARNSQSGWDR